MSPLCPCKMQYTVWALVLWLLLGVPATGTAQTTPLPLALECPEPVADSQAPPDFSVSDGVLDYVERMERSTFVRAYLLALFAEEGSRQHALSNRARAFQNADLQDILRCEPAAWNLPDVDEMVDALRNERARVDALRRISEAFDTAPVRAELDTHLDAPLNRLDALRGLLRREALSYQPEAFDEPSFSTLKDELDANRTLVENVIAWLEARRAQAVLVARREHLAALADAARLATDAVGSLTREDSSALSVGAPMGESLLDLYAGFPTIATASDAESGEAAGRIRDGLLSILATRARVRDSAAAAPPLPASVRTALDSEERARREVGRAIASYREANGGEDPPDSYETAAAALPAATATLMAALGWQGETLDEDQVGQLLRARLERLMTTYSDTQTRVASALKAPETRDDVSAAVRGIGQAAAVEAIDEPPPPALTGGGAPTGVPAGALWALTDLLLARAQEEVVLGFLQRVNRWFGDGQNEQDILRQTFPTTFRLTTASQLRLFEVPRASWRNALRDDLRGLPLALLRKGPARRALLDRLFSTPQDPRLPTEEARGAAALPADPRPHAEALLDAASLIVSLSEQLIAGSSAMDLTVALQDSLQATALTAHSFFSRLGISDDAASRIRAAANVMGGLARDFRVQGGLPPTTTLPASLPGYLLALSQFDAASPGLQAQYVHLLALAHLQPIASALPADTTRLNDRVVTEATRGLMRMLELSQNRLAAIRDASADARLAAYRDYVTTALQHTDALFDFSHALTSAPGDTAIQQLRTTWSGATAVYGALAQGAYTDALARTVLLYNEMTSRRVPERFFRIATLAASVATARTGAEMEAAFRSAALPAGGFRGKRTGRGLSPAVTAFLGLGAGYERAFVPGLDSLDNAGSAFGLALPVGLEVRIPWPIRQGLSLYMPLIDLGALASFRVQGRRIDADTNGATDATVSSFPNVTLRQVFSPGGYLVVAPWPTSSPFVIGFGVQLMPQLRTVDVEGSADTGDTQTRADVLRFGAFLGVDLTLFRF